MPQMNASEEFLRPVNLHNPEEFRALQEQRVLCGWNYDHTVIEKWSRMMDNKQKSLFWIHEPDQDARIGHVSLDCITDPPNPDLANPDKSVMTIATFFILEQYRSHGFARQAMDILEAWAIEEPWGSPNCKAIALTTLDRRYIVDSGDEWRGIWARLGRPRPAPDRIHEDWYTRRGYVKWKSEPMYGEKTLDGTSIKLNAVFLRKTLQPS